MNSAVSYDNGSVVKCRIFKEQAEEHTDRLTYAQSPVALRMSGQKQMVQSLSENKEYRTSRRCRGTDTRGGRGNSLRQLPRGDDTADIYL